MSRDKIVGQKPIEEYYVFHGYDVDVKKWFIEIEIPSLGSGYITRWYDSEKLYEELLQKLIIRGQ
tara:strand:+ start:69 stop:263 length:195 start_codon:yes stop_codon:yes gene_type:complete